MLDFDYTKLLPSYFADSELASNSRMYIMSGNTVNSIANYMYNQSNNFFSGQDKIFGANIADAIRSIRMYPFIITDNFKMIDRTSIASATMCGKPISDFPTVSAGDWDCFATTGNGQQTTATYSAHVRHFGSFNIPYFQNIDSYLSYEPYTRIELYLPFCSEMIPLDAKRVRGHIIDVDGIFDFVNGDLIYIVSIRTQTKNVYLLHTKTHISIDIETYGTNYREVFKQGFDNLLQFVKTMYTKNVFGLAYDAMNMYTMETTHSKVTSGDMQSLLGYNAPLVPHILMYEPVITYNLNDTDYAHIQGIPSQKIKALHNFSGFTVVEEVHMQSIVGATDPEINEIENLLKKGVRV